MATRSADMDSSSTEEKKLKQDQASHHEHADSSTGHHDGHHQTKRHGLPHLGVLGGHHHGPPKDQSEIERIDAEATAPNVSAESFKHLDEAKILRKVMPNQPPGSMRSQETER